MSPQTGSTVDQIAPSVPSKSETGLVCKGCGIHRMANDGRDTTCCRGTFMPGLGFKCVACGKREEDHEPHGDVLLCPEWVNRNGDPYDPDEEFVLQIVDQSRRAEAEARKKQRLAEDDVVRERVAYDYVDILRDRAAEALQTAAKEELLAQKKIQALEISMEDSSIAEANSSIKDSFQNLLSEYQFETKTKRISMAAVRAKKQAKDAEKAIEQAQEEALGRTKARETSELRAATAKTEASQLRDECARVTEAFERNQQAKAFDSIVVSLESSIERDDWHQAVEILEEAITYNAHPLQPALSQLWKFCLLCPSGVQWLRESGFRQLAHGHLDASWHLTSNPWLRINFKHLKVMVSPAITELDGMLTSVDLSNFPHLEKLPVKAISSMRSLRSVECKGCPNLVSPPPEVAVQGGEAVMEFLREAERDGLLNTDMLLFLIGDGEAGKTSTIRALMSPDDRAAPVGMDRRTVGIDVSHWDADADLNFRVLDLAGQKVYTVTHKFFLAQRAVYLLVWRASPLEDSDEAAWVARQQSMISRWLDLLQCRVPGTPVMLVVTHTDPDIVSPEHVDVQCKAVREAVEKRCVESDPFPCRVVHRLRAHANAGDVAPLRVVNGGDSLRVDCLNGAGVAALRRQVVQAAKGVRWYAEALPSSWVRLQREVEECSKTRHWLQYAEYREKARAVGVQDSMLQVATKFLHETGRLKYFGSDGQGEVYVSPAWGIQIFKGVMRDSRSALFRFLQRDPRDGAFKAECREQLDRLLRCLQVCGELHQHLLPFLWPGDLAAADAAVRARLAADGSADSVREELCAEYWGGVRGARAGSGREECVVMERESWEETLDAEPYKGLVEGHLDADHPAMKLLIRFHIVAKVGVPSLEGGRTAHVRLPEKFVVPELLGQHRGDILDSRCYTSTDCPWWTRWTLLFLPVGFLSGLFLRVRAKATHADQGLWSGAFYRRGGMVQIFVQHKAGEEGLTVTLRASTRERFSEALDELEQHCRAYPGLPVTRREALRKAHADRVRQVAMVTAADLTRSTTAQRLREELEAMADIGEVAVLSETEAGEGARILLVLVDPLLGAAYAGQRWMRERMEALRSHHCKVIPVIMPGYQISDSSRWWPPSMEAFLARHSLFVKLAADNWDHKVHLELKRRIYTLLDDWRGQPPKTVVDDAGDSQQDGATESAVAAPMSDEEVVCCPSCSRRGLGGKWRGNSNFLKSELEEELEGWVARRDQGRKEGLPTRRCRHGHKHDVMELLSSPLVRDAIPCPRCRVLPPSCFDRSYCFAHYVEKRHGNVRCERCQVHVPLREVLKPAIFVSYNWGFRGSTKKIVMPLCRRVEDKTDMLCWLDELGGMAAGDDKDAAMRSGIRDASIVLVFLSDAYVTSPACQYEFAQAVRMGKFVIPLLLPTPSVAAHDQRDAQDVDIASYGWGGRGPEAGKEDWWQHVGRVQRAGSGLRRGSQAAWRDDVPWWALSLFNPIDLRREPRTSEGGLEPNSRAEEEVVHRIMARIHRDTHVHYSSAPGWKRFRNAFLALRAFASPAPSASHSRRSSVTSNYSGSAPATVRDGKAPASPLAVSPLAAQYRPPARRRSTLEAPPPVPGPIASTDRVPAVMESVAESQWQQPEHVKDLDGVGRRNPLFVASPSPPLESPTARKVLPPSPMLSRRSSSISASNSRRSSMEMAAGSRRSSQGSVSDSVLDVRGGRHSPADISQLPASPVAKRAEAHAPPTLAALVAAVGPPSPPAPLAKSSFRLAFPTLFSGSSSMLVPAPSESLSGGVPPRGLQPQVTTAQASRHPWPSSTGRGVGTGASTATGGGAVSGNTIVSRSWSRRRAAFAIRNSKSTSSLPTRAPQPPSNKAAGAGSRGTAAAR